MCEPQAEAQMSETAYYADRWERFECANSIALARIAQILAMMEAAEMSERPAICDLGCGAGWATGILGVFGQAVGVDLAPPESARQKYPYCEFVATDILKWGQGASRFDVVVSQETLEHINESKQAVYLEIASRLLRPGGYLILTTPNRRTMEAFRDGGRSWSNQPVENWLYAHDLKQLLRQGGFEIAQFKSFAFGYGCRGLYRLINSYKLNNVIRLLGIAPLWRYVLGRGNFGLHFAVLARKSHDKAATA